MVYCNRCGDSHVSGKCGLKTRLEGDDSCMMTTRASAAAKAGGKSGDSSMEDVVETTTGSIDEQEKKACAEIEALEAELRLGALEARLAELWLERERQIDQIRHNGESTGESSTAVPAQTG